MLITMARISPNSFFFILTIVTLLSFINYQVIAQSDNLSDGSNWKLIKEKLTHFRMYWHDILSGSNPTSIQVVKPPTNTRNGFGLVNMIDNPLTLGPELSSQVVGKAQGFYALASQEEIAFLMYMNFVFTWGEYNGSTITILGRNSIFNKVREMPVVGGSGLFRFARGYVEARTQEFDTESGDATVEYNVYVMHQ